ncbi:hypothetical protein CROQUDRAFT_50721 [Cronartium quercuum f. sp. fusiforme G11]|uniref:VanZ-like domain-containing protein n=1 Tax=Cronartium quercuum f. sp. fusiforme G11 TaxID=708437 RepID=A0A9P6T832_9BASI|nr:hypothetical protein CROQUDRAFT_50721 [Cronartium quercuum f. sp. fusiforme G11]
MKSYPISHLTTFLRPTQPAISLSHDRTLPIRIRPAFSLATLLTIIILAIMGFNPSIHAFIALPKKLFHFFSFALVTGLFYSITDVDDSVNFIWYWKHFSTFLTILICFIFGGLGTELIQLLLPWKVFAGGDLLANLLGCFIGYQISRSLHKTYKKQKELQSLYEPLDRNLSEFDQDELDEDEQSVEFGKTFLNSNHPSLQNVWSDNLDEESTEYFRFDDHEAESR